MVYRNTKNQVLTDQFEQTLSTVPPAIIFAVEGGKSEQVKHKFDQPEHAVVKNSVLVQAHQYGTDWLVVKHDEVE